MDILRLTRKKGFYLIFILLSAFLYRPVFSQTKARITDVDFTLDGRYIIINYKIVGNLPKEEMTIELKFVSDLNETIVPRSIMNDVGTKLYGDGQKAIVWDIVSDQITLTGNWKASIAIVSSRILYSGAGNAFLSMIIPGLGGYYVDTKKGRAVLTTLSVIGFGAYGAFEKIQANKYYEDYKAATKSAGIEDLFSKANDCNHNYFIATRVAAGIMALDVIYVLFKGAHNRKVAKNAYNAYSEDGFRLKHVNNGFQIGYSLTF
jgi:hypothetical protein